MNAILQLHPPIPVTVGSPLISGRGRAVAVTIGLHGYLEWLVIMDATRQCFCAANESVFFDRQPPQERKLPADFEERLRRHSGYQPLHEK